MTPSTTDDSTEPEHVTYPVHDWREYVNRSNKDAKETNGVVWLLTNSHGDVAFYALRDAFNADALDVEVPDDADKYVAVTARRDGENTYIGSDQKKDDAWHTLMDHLGPHGAPKNLGHEGTRDERVEAARAVNEALTTPATESTIDPMQGTSPTEDSENDDLPNVNREYDWESHVPHEDEVHDYVPTNGEWDRINAIIEARHSLDKLPHFRISGPTGCGKTTLAENIATHEDREWPMFEIQFNYDMVPADLLGSPQLRDGGETYWTDGPLTKALIASREGPVVILCDEVNRARPEVFSTLMSAMDHRGRVELDARGGEVIQGDPSNMIVLSTMNEGKGYKVEDLDKAQARRLGDKHTVDYLYRDRPEKFVDIMTERTPAGEALANEMVGCAEDIMEVVEDDTGNVNHGVPTSGLLEWADAAYAYHEADVENAVIKAAEDTIIRKQYDDNDEARQSVANAIKSRLDGVGFHDSDVKEHQKNPNVTCTNCEWGAPKDEAESQGALDFMECPECGEMVKIRDGGGE